VSKYAAAKPHFVILSNINFVVTPIHQRV
jgi:hypothetical protein